MSILLQLLALCLTFSLAIQPTCAQDSKEILKQLEYPELVVTPLASQRLKDEAQNEKGNSWSRWTPIQLSAAITLASGLSSNGDYDKGLIGNQEIKNNKDGVDNASQFATTVGAGWLAGTIWLSVTYSPYEKGYSEIKESVPKTKKQKLAQERKAEEYIHRAGEFTKKIKYISLVSNLLANAYVLAEAQEDSQTTAAFGVLGSFLPILFPLHWETTSQTHNDYKKKIYGPISSMVPTQNGWVPTVGLAMSF